MATAGIDFGTTNSVVAIHTRNGPEVLPIDAPADANWASLGFDRVMPTVLGLAADQTTLFGWKAKLSTDVPALEAVKRMMAGSDFVQIGDEDVLVEQVVALFFRHLVKQAALVGSHDIDRVVVTVPANSRGIARHRTRLCAQLAGLEVLTLINEPTAAAMAAAARMAHDGKVVVIDWGGGTLDVTALESSHGVFIEQGSSGEPMLGGKDFDAKFATSLIETVPDFQWTPGTRRAFALEVELAKIRLSSQPFTNVTLPTGATTRVTRDQFEQVTRPLVERLRRPIEDCLRIARWAPSMADHVLLVGGTGNIPAVNDLVSEIFGRPPTAGVNPMTAIAEGAAIAAAIMTGEVDNDFFVSTEHALGTIALDDSMTARFSTIIGRGHKLPAVGRDTYFPIHPQQESVNVQVVEGDPDLPLDDDLNVQIAEWDVQLPPPDRGDNRSFELEYRYDVEGILHVKATDNHTGAVLLEETVGSKTSRDRRELVKIAGSVKETTETGRLQPRPIDHTVDPEVAVLLQNARTKVIPFVDDDEAAVLRRLAGELEDATGSAVGAAKDRLRKALSSYSYLL